MGEYTSLYAEADTNSDELLDRSEFGVFEGKIFDWRVETYGDYFEFTEDELDAWFEAINGISDADGISLDDY